MNPDIHIIARASHQIAVRKLKKAGANEVVMHDSLGGKHMAELVIKPNVVRLMNLLEGEGDGIHMDEYSCKKFKAEYQNSTILQLKPRETTGVSILAYKDSKDNFQLIHRLLQS